MTVSKYDHLMGTSKLKLYTAGDNKSKLLAGEQQIADATAAQSKFESLAADIEVAELALKQAQSQCEHTVFIEWSDYPYVYRRCYACALKWIYKKNYDRSAS